MIPKKIHYCWYGGKPMPLMARRCLASWQYHLPDYELVCWDEESFEPAQHPFAAAAYAAGKYAFVSDYVRMQILHQQGGIYLDVDVEMRGNFDQLLNLDLFIGLEDVRRFATSVIGCAPGHWLARDMLAFYDRTPFDVEQLSALVNVNHVSAMLLARGFNGEGGEQQLGAEKVLALGVFADARSAAHDIEPLACHLYAGSWRSRSGKSLPSRMMRWLKRLPKLLESLLRLWGYRLAVLLRMRTRPKC